MASALGTGVILPRPVGARFPGNGSTFDVDVGEPAEPRRQVPVALAQELHRCRDKHGADDRGAELVDLVLAVSAEGHLGCSAPGSPMAADAPTQAPPPEGGTNWTVGRILLVTLGSIVALIAAGLLAAGGVALWADLTQRDDDGYLTTPTERLETESYAITSESIDLFETDTSGDWVLPRASSAACV